MQASREELEQLLHLQTLDLEIRNKQKQLDTLPQREQIIEVRKKRAQIQEKQTQVDALLREVNKKIDQQSFEDDQLAKKQDETQAKINETSGDYRGIEALTKELNGFAKRRATLADSLAGLRKKQAEIEAVKQQVSSADQTLAQQEDALTRSYQEEGGRLLQEQAEAKGIRAQLADTLDTAFVGAYEKSAARFSGVGIALLKNNSCSACRNLMDENHLLKLKRNAPLATCPACGRLIIVS